MDIGARLNFTTGDYECIIKDASLGGMLVSGPFMLVLDKNCPVNIELRSRSTNLSFVASAQVVRADENGMAIEFTSMGFDSYVSLQTLLLYNAEDPFAIGVEFPDDPPFGRRSDA
ncbi:MAG: PilZ domain-containing protein [Desulfobulbaceae bacterium]|nr:PilZ domain-containing protein [Desulfobulbaceae bacterium]